MGKRERFDLIDLFLWLWGFVGGWAGWGFPKGVGKREEAFWARWFKREEREREREVFLDAVLLCLQWREIDGRIENYSKWDFVRLRGVREQYSKAEASTGPSSHFLSPHPPESIVRHRTTDRAINTNYSKLSSNSSMISSLLVHTLVPSIFYK